MKFQPFIELIQQSYQETPNLSVFIRHADRNLKDTQNLGIEEPLNELGAFHSQQFGKNLSSIKIHKIFTSPVKRCLQTANYIQIGYGRNLIIQESNLLGLPGIHIHDEKIAAKCFQKHSTYEVYKSYVKNHGLEGFHQPEYIFQKLNEFCIQNIHSEHINLYITHDILLAIWIYAYNGKVYHLPKWIDFLTGFIIKHYDERKFEIVIY